MSSYPTSQYVYPGQPYSVYQQPAPIPTSPNPSIGYYSYNNYPQISPIPRYMPVQVPSPTNLPIPEAQRIPRSPYRHIYNRKVHFDLPNTVQNPKSPIPGFSNLNPVPQYNYPSPYPPSAPTPSVVHTASPNVFPVSQVQPVGPGPYYYPQTAGKYYNTNEYIRDIHGTYRNYFDDQAQRDYFLSLVKAPLTKHLDPKKKLHRKSEPPKPYFPDRHFDTTAFSNPFSEADKVMYFLQLVDFKAGNKPNSPICEHLLFRPIKDGKLTGSRGILVQFVEQNKNNQSSGSQWSLESQPDYDPTSSDMYVGFKNIGFVPNIERFLDLAVFIPIPLDGTPKDPETNTIPLPSFQAWSAIVFMEARMRNYLIPQNR